MRRRQRALDRACARIAAMARCSAQLNFAGAELSDAVLALSIVSGPTIATMKLEVLCRRFTSSLQAYT
jgi:hypothetical protein